MANELAGYGASGVQHDFVLYSTQNQVANIAPGQISATWEDWQDAHYLMYATPATEQGTSGRHIASIPPDILTTATSWDLRKRLLSSPTIGDPMVDRGSIMQNVIPPTTIPPAVHEDNDINLIAPPPAPASKGVKLLGRSIQKRPAPPRR
jgi:hypothetical protein